MTQMIDLDTPIEAVESKEVDTSILDKGDYSVKFIGIKDWTSKTFPTYDVNVYDDRKQLMRDADGKIIKETVKNLTVFSTTATLEVVSGPRAGKRIFVDLTTNPNRPWDLAKFVKGLGAGSVAPSHFIDHVGALMEVKVDIESYPYKDYVDSKTGETVFANSRNKNVVKYYKPIESDF